MFLFGGAMMDERNDIAGIMGALAVHVDARRWPELLSLFALEVHVDYTSLFGGEPQVMAREDLIAGWQRLLPDSPARPMSSGRLR